MNMDRQIRQGLPWREAPAFWWPDSADTMGAERVRGKHPQVTSMSRNLYILSAALVLFALASFGMSWIHGSNEPGLPGVAQMWRTMALGLFLLGALSCLVGTLTNLFEQASRRYEERERRQGKRP